MRGLRCGACMCDAVAGYCPLFLAIHSNIMDQPLAMQQGHDLLKDGGS